MQELAMVKIEENRKCSNFGWIGKRNALLKHLRMKSKCKSKYDMKSVYDRQKIHKIMKKKKQHYNSMHFAKRQEKKKQAH